MSFQVSTETFRANLETNAVSAPTGTLALHGNVQAKQDVTVTGNTSVGGALTTVGKITAGGALEVLAATTIQNQLYVGYNALSPNPFADVVLSAVPGTGVGVYTASPSAALEVVGSAKVSNIVQTNPTYVQRQVNTTQSLTSGTTATVLFHTQTTSSGSPTLTYDSSTGKFTSTATSTRAYLISGYLAYAQLTTSAIQLWVTKNSEQVRRSYATADGPLSNNGLEFSCTLLLANNDTFKVEVVQTSGAAVNLLNTTNLKSTIDILAL